MSEMIERVAKAIARSIPTDSGAWNPGYGENFPQEYSEREKALIRAIAAIAIEAMRDSTGTMDDKGGRVESLDETIGPHRAAEVWETMIDEALK